MNTYKVEVTWEVSSSEDYTVEAKSESEAINEAKLLFFKDSTLPVDACLVDSFAKEINNESLSS